jgi:hypothetical protein
MEELITKIVKFNDGRYFNGVKGKMVRKTTNFKDAKIIKNELSERDKGYLSMFGKTDYELIKVKYTMEEL